MTHERTTRYVAVLNGRVCERYAWRPHYSRVVAGSTVHPVMDMTLSQLTAPPVCADVRPNPSPTPDAPFIAEWTSPSGATRSALLGAAVAPWTPFI